MSSSDLSPSAAARAQHLDPICSGRPPAVPRQPPPPAPLRAAAAACRGTSAPRAALRGGRREAGTLSGTGAATERCFGRGEPRDKRYILGVRSGVSAAVRAGARSSRSPLFVAAAFFYGERGSKRFRQNSEQDRRKSWREAVFSLPFCGEKQCCNRLVKQGTPRASVQSQSTAGARRCDGEHRIELNSLKPSRVSPQVFAFYALTSLLQQLGGVGAQKSSGGGVRGAGAPKRMFRGALLGSLLLGCMVCGAA